MTAKIGVRARFFSILPMLVLSGCAQTADVACTMDAKVCPDGSYVGRNPQRNCEFNPCLAKSSGR
jgi:hypothetical protein